MKALYRNLVAIAVGVIGGLACGPAAHAQATYDYTAPDNFNLGTVGGYGAPLQSTSIYGSSLSGVVSFDNAVTANFTGAASAADILSWSLSSGPLQVSSLDSGSVLQYADFSFVNGTITEWLFQVASNASSDETTLGTAGSNGTIRDEAVIYSAGAPTGNALITSYAANSAGPWTLASSTAVPEPGSAVLLLAALAGLTACNRRGRLGLLRRPAR